MKRPNVRRTERMKMLFKRASLFKVAKECFRALVCRLMFGASLVLLDDELAAVQDLSIDYFHKVANGAQQLKSEVSGEHH